MHGILSLALDVSAVKRLGNLPALHPDPFDRMLVCQAQDQALRLASSDPVFRQYPVMRL
jgi:PIN domain nuclease of toxin-antitoxin system